MRIAMPSNTGVVRTDIADLITRAKGLDANYDVYVGDRHAAYWTYSGALAAGATYQPAAFVETMTAVSTVTNTLSCVGSPGNLYPGQPNNFGFFGSFRHDGSSTGFKNNAGAGISITLHGLVWS